MDKIHEQDTYVLLTFILKDLGGGLLQFIFPDVYLRVQIFHYGSPVSSWLKGHLWASLLGLVVGFLSVECLSAYHPHPHLVSLYVKLTFGGGPDMAQDGNWTLELNPHLSFVLKIELMWNAASLLNIKGMVDDLI